jgi:hypothetical protein
LRAHTAELREAFIKEGGVSQVLKAAGTKEIKVQRALATCLANLAQEAEAVKDVIGGDGLKKVLAWITQGDEELTGSAISILANASNNGNNIRSLLAPHALQRADVSLNTNAHAHRALQGASVAGPRAGRCAAAAPRRE